MQAGKYIIKTFEYYLLNNETCNIIMCSKHTTLWVHFYSDRSRVENKFSPKHRLTEIRHLTEALKKIFLWKYGTEASAFRSIEVDMTHLNFFFFHSGWNSHYTRGTSNKIEETSGFLWSQIAISGQRFSIYSLPHIVLCIENCRLQMGLSFCLVYYYDDDDSMKLIKIICAWLWCCYKA